MAEGGCDLEREITCSVCHETFDDPRLLPCDHCFCKKCIQDLVKDAGPVSRVLCPECRAETDIPRNDPNLLPKNLLASKMKDIFLKMQKDANPRHEMCEKHDDPLRLYCFDCAHLICRDCTVFDHKRHNHKFIKDAAPQMRAELRTEMEVIKSFRKRYSNATERVKATSYDVKFQRGENVEAITKWMNRSTEIITKFAFGLLEETRRSAQLKIINLELQEKRFESFASALQDLESKCEQMFDNTTNEEYVKVHQEHLREVNDASRRHQNADLEVAEIADLKVQLPSDESLMTLCCNEAKVVATAQADPSRCSVLIEPTEVNKESQLTVCTRYQNSAICKKPQEIVALLKSMADGSLTQINLVKKNAGSYEMTYTPQIRGLHKLAVAVNGKQVTGSPFNVYVKIQPTQLGPAIKVVGFRGYGKPYLVVSHCPDKLIVLTTDEILVLNKSDCKMIKAVESFRKDSLESSFSRLLGQNVRLRGITVDNHANMFISDTVQNMVLKLDADGNQLKVIGKRGSGNGEFNDPGGMAIVGEHVFVCDCENHRIQVLTRDLEFVKTIGSFGTGNGEFNKIRDICPDETGNLYVCDSYNSRIQIITSDGHFLTTFGSKGTGNGEMDRPVSLCVAGQLVYVADYGNTRVSVFDRNGLFVTFFNIEGGRPTGIAVDDNGFVYVCVHSAGNVTIF